MAGSLSASTRHAGALSRVSESAQLSRSNCLIHTRPRVRANKTRHPYVTVEEIMTRKRREHACRGALQGRVDLIIWMTSSENPKTDASTRRKQHQASGVVWRNGRVLDSEPRGPGFES
ncbi:hypothetical protein Bbelb_161600 [Branchiostoma belcheri]|nr:hypothetical protein Bbelb_161600 [Branchiostoma belcheri]